MRRGALLAAVGVALVGAWLPGPAQAANFDVACGDVTGFVAAVNAANAAGGASTITLAPSCTYTFTVPAVGLTALPIITADITIAGNNATLARSATAGALRFFFVNGSGTLRLNNVTLKDGFADVGGGVFIASNGHLTTSNATFRDNAVTGGGGGIFGDNPSDVTLTNSVFDHNNGGSEGGAIATSGVLKMTASRVINNSVSSSPIALGGGIFIGRGTVDIASSEISGNTVTSPGGVSAVGGGIYAGNVPVQVTLTSVRLQNNSVASDSGCSCVAAQGGGIFSAGTLNATGLIATGNSATAPTSGAVGGAIRNAGVATVTNSRLSDNTVTGGIILSAGGGAADSHTLSLSGVSVTNNHVVGGTPTGGGLQELSTGAISLSGSSVVLNSPDNCRPVGAVPGCNN